MNMDLDAFAAINPLSLIQFTFLNVLYHRNYVHYVTMIIKQ